MRRSPLPDWLIYCAAVGAVVFAGVTWRQRANAPPAPPPVPALDTGLASDASFEPGQVKPVPRGPRQVRAGTAFSVSADGVWLTARHVVEDCRSAAILVGEGRGVVADVLADTDADVAVLRTDGGGPPLPLALRPELRDGQRAFHPGFPKGEAGEATSIYLGRTTLREAGRGARKQSVLAWSESGRTDGVRGSLEGLSGAPVLDEGGQVVGVTLGESPRRGRLYAAPMTAVRHALARARAAHTGQAPNLQLSIENYGRIADGLRRDLAVVPVACLR